MRDGPSWMLMPWLPRRPRATTTMPWALLKRVLGVAADARQVRAATSTMACKGWGCAAMTAAAIDAVRRQQCCWCCWLAMQREVDGSRRVFERVSAG